MSATKDDSTISAPLEGNIDSTNDTSTSPVSAQLETTKTTQNENKSVNSDNNQTSPGNDTASLGSTISHLVGVLSPNNNETTSVSQVNITTSTSSPNAKTDDNKKKSLEVVNEIIKEDSNSIPVEPKIHPTPITSIQSQPGIKFTPADELKASFTGVSNKNTDPISMVLPSASSSTPQESSPGDKSTSSGIIGGFGMALGMFGTEKENNDVSTNGSQNPGMVKSSPLLSSTPPTVSKSLIKAYPFLILTLKALNILTWNDDESNHLSIFLVLLAAFSILYYEPLVKYMGHLLPVFALWIYSECKSYIIDQQSKHSTLDDIIQTVTLISKRSEVLISPIVELDLSAGDLKRLLFTTVFLSPVYVVISFFILPPNKLFLILTVLVLTYHSKWSKVTRTLLWKSRTFRLLCFYLTGLDFENSGLTKASTLFNLNKKLSNKFGKNSSNSKNGTSNQNNTKSSVRFTYVIYENQRRWLGVGWTPNLLSYERTPWTDEFLNESEPIETFELPQLPLSIDIQDAENGENKIGTNNGEDEVMNTKGMVWRWIDKTWRLDLTNDGSIQLPSTRPKTTANPKADDGWIYYDNTWKNPSTEDGFSKYTRRRRWIRTAELVYIGNNSNSGNNLSENHTGKEVKFTNNTGTSEKTLRFASPDTEDAESSNESIHESKSTGNKKGESGHTKKRKSLRFEEPAQTD